MKELFFKNRIIFLEENLWNHNDDCNETNRKQFYKTLKEYQQLFLDHESSINSKIDNRYDFILSIPIADRPEHLKNCLESIFQLCEQYGYGGKKDGFYAKMTVIVVEDSKDSNCRKADAKLAQEYSEKGLRTLHYDLHEQYELMMQLPEETRKGIASIIGEPKARDFYRKGQAFARNLAYLKCLQLEHNRNWTLYYFVDSDQLFQANLATKNGDETVYALNYFHYINQIFSTTNTLMLTGKLVGDPPVSPAVMVVNYLEDLIVFIQQIAQLDPEADCQFHPDQINKPNDAAYHDLAKLFGFEKKTETFDYRCTLTGKHNNRKTFHYFCQKVGNFFFGEHLTRKTYFEYDGDFTKLVPARTIYPGNYIVNFEGLKYIIPFGGLRLRMSGPTAGRLIQAEIGERFASVNLPMLHMRTLNQQDNSDDSNQNQKYQDEFRPGVENDAEKIDLSDESERQFFGDLMLFTVNRMMKNGISPDQFSQDVVEEHLNIIEQELLELYRDTQNNVMQKTAEFLEILDHPQVWWNRSSNELYNKSNDAEALKKLRQFIENCRHNFGAEAKAYQQIESEIHRKNRKQQIMQAILSYRQDRDAWDQLFS